MKIAIVGSGISGLTAAYYLQDKHDITLFEANDYIGGHTHTHQVESQSGTLRIDTGFIVFNDRTYPHFCKLLGELNVKAQNTDMSFGVKCDQSGLEYRGADLNGLFAQRSNIFNYKYLCLLKDLLRFNQQSAHLNEDQNESQTVGDFFGENRYHPYFINKYFLPMASAIWSCPTSAILDFPIQFIVDFYHHHGLLSVTNRPQWKVIQNGSKSYIDPLIAKFKDRIQLSNPVHSLKRRGPQNIELRTKANADTFNHVIFACHSGQALKILGPSTTNIEKEVLGAFPYGENTAILHTDVSVLAKNKRARACWNYHIPQQIIQDKQQQLPKATVSYYMNLLQDLRTPEHYCVTLNPTVEIATNKIIKTLKYEHPIFSKGRKVFQKRHSELINQQDRSFCGAYWGNGFHEDGVASALRVCSKL